MKRLSLLVLFAGVLCAATLLGKLYSAGRDQPAETAADRPAVSAPRETPPPPAQRPAYAGVRIAGVPHIKQKPDFCGEACAAMVLAKLGHRINQDDVFDQAGLDPELGRGCYTKELSRALTRIGFRVGTVWFSVAAAQAEAELESHFRALHADLLAGVPSIVCTRYDDTPEASEHFRLVLGYDYDKDEVLYHEPAAAGGAYARMRRLQFLSLWPLKYDADRWTVIRLRLVPGEIRDVHSTAKFTAADYAQCVMAAKRKAPEGFSIVVQKPFVVIGDELAADVRRHAVGTVQWAVDHLKQEYFAEDPNEILEIWLFQDKASYGKHTVEIFGDTPDTPFGYFSHQHKALIMNIDTGTGTLVHEIVHPFIAANFPECPSWFNEGLASLYEQCQEYRGRIWGRTNWRLAGLQEVIQPKPEPAPKPDLAQDPAAKPAAKPAPASLGGQAPKPADMPEVEGDEAREEPPKKELPSFRTLCHTTTYEFYARDPGTNYAQARYLCYYLQQRGLLREYYRQFRDNVRDDPSGYETLKSVLGISSEEEMAQFHETWKAWVMKLRYP